MNLKFFNYRLCSVGYFLFLFCVFCFSKGYAQNNAIFNGGNSDGFSVNCAGSIGNELSLLPIELVSFTGKCQPMDGYQQGGDNATIVLQWSTASETNNDYFTLERSRDAINWLIRGTVKGSGNSSTILNYSFSDTKPHSEIFYYRLKSTDFDGKYKYSTVITVENCGEDLTRIKIYPNPTNGIFNLELNGGKEQIRSIDVFNVLGEIIYHSEIYQSAIYLSDTQNGMYFIHIYFNSKISNEKIMLER